MRDGGAGARRGMQHDPGAVRDRRLAFVVASRIKTSII